MAIWLPYKAPPGERKNRKRKETPQYYRAKLCKICGRPINSGKYCGSCDKYIKVMLRKEKGKNADRKN